MYFHINPKSSTPAEYGLQVLPNFLPELLFWEVNFYHSNQFGKFRSLYFAKEYSNLPPAIPHIKFPPVAKTALSALLRILSKEK